MSDGTPETNMANKPQHINYTPTPPRGTSQHNVDLGKGDGHPVTKKPLDVQLRDEYIPRESTPIRENPVSKCPEHILSQAPGDVKKVPHNTHAKPELPSDINHALSSLRFQPMSTSDKVNTPLSKKERIPDKFDGSTSEWQDYFRHFETVAGWNGWNEKERAMQLIMSLKGQAQQILGDVPSHILNDYLSLVAELNRRFNPAERDEAYQMEFRSRRRKAGGTPMEFGYVLRRLAAKAFPEVSWSEQEIWIPDQFIGGLGSRELRKHVKFGHPKNLHAAISLAVEFETFESSYEQSDNHKPRQNGMVQSIDKTISEDVDKGLKSQIDNLCQAMEKLANNSRPNMEQPGRFVNQIQMGGK